MGNQSTTFSEYVDTAVNSTLNTNFVTDNTAEADTVTSSYLYQRLDVGGQYCCSSIKDPAAQSNCITTLAGLTLCKSIDAEATIGVKVSVIQKSDQQVSTDITNAMTTLIQNQVDSIQKQLNSATIPSFSNQNQSNSISLKNTLNDIVNTTVSTSNIALIRQTTFDSVNQTIHVCGKVDGPCEIKGTVVADIFLSNIATQITNNIASNKAANESYDAAKNEQSQSKSDIFGVFADALKSVFTSTAFVIIAIIGGVFLLFFVVLKGIFGKSPPSPIIEGG